MTELLHSPGFLGTRANLAADVTLILGLFVAALFTTGVVLAKRKNYDAHRWCQTAAAALNAILVLWLMVLPFRDFVVRNVGGPRDSIFYIVTSIHATIGSIALLFGVFVALRGNELMISPLKFRNYKFFMRLSYTFYMAATLLGILVYLTWFVWLPPGQTPVYG